MEYEAEEKEGGFMQRLKDSPRTVSALIIILIIAAAIYAFSGNEGQIEDEGIVVGEEETTGEEAAVEEGEEAMAEKEGEEAMMEKPATTPRVVEQAELSQQAQAEPQEEKTETGYVETAQAGDGITHLARRASTRWLAENSAGYQVTNEHRIYIEDYIQNRIGTQGLNMGESHTITFELIQEAVAAAGELNEQQLQNLTQYSSVLNS